MTAPLIPAVWSHFLLNLLLQAVDGVLTYQIVSAGVPEANPLVQRTITELGLIGGLVYSKTFTCVLLCLIFALRHRQQSLTVNAFPPTAAAVYACVSVIVLCAALLQLE